MAMAAGASKTLWPMDDVVKMAEEWETPQRYLSSVSLLMTRASLSPLPAISTKCDAGTHRSSSAEAYEIPLCLLYGQTPLPWHAPGHRGPKHPWDFCECLSVQNSRPTSN
jgi:hypothetical protein